MATAVGLAMKIGADLSGFHKEMAKSKEGFDKFEQGLGDLETIIWLLQDVVKLLTVQLEVMHAEATVTRNAINALGQSAAQSNAHLQEIEKTSLKTTEAMASLAKSVSGLAAAYATFTKQNLLFNAAVGSATGGMGFFTKTILKGAIARVLGLTAGLTTGATALYGIGVAAAAAAPGLKSLESFTERLNIEATKLGTSFAFIQTLEVAASRSGESIDSLRVAFTALLRNIEAARDGAQGSVAAFGKLGITVSDLETQTPEEIFKRIATALQSIEDPATRSATALVVLGENGARLQPALRSIAEAEADLARFSATLDRLDNKRLEDIGRGADSLQTAFSGLGRQLVLPFAGLVAGVEKALADVIGGVSAVIAPLGDAVAPFLDILGAVVQTIGGFIGVALKLIGSVLEPLALAFRLGGEAVAFLADGLDYLFTKVNQGIDAFRAFFGLPEFGVISSGAAESAAAIEEMTTASQNFANEIANAAEKAADFGQAGFDAALKYQESLEEINALKEEGEYTEEQAAEAARRANEVFEERIDLLKKQAEEQKKAAEEAKKAAEEDQRRIEQFRQSGLSSQEKEQEEAAQTVLAIQREQSRIEQEIAAARAAGDQAAIDAGAARLAQLDQEEARAADIASGEAARRAEAAEKEKEYQGKLADMRAEFVRNEIKRQEEIAGKRDEYNQKLAEMEAERLDKLAKTNQKALQASDIRSGGIAQVIALATGREDPAVEESRKQRKTLENIEKEIRKLGGTVDIVGAA